ncbi:MAG: hypothetical protein Q8Q54_04935 [Methylococcales bacterium]|nr:hypothetical protein [Methylococcales bacterium]MDP3838249.1 hypothetical protein [Methylococcales bacterium]
MEIICKNCNTSHFLSDDKIPLETKTGKCKKCNAPITVLGKNATVSIEPTPIQSTPPEPEATKNCDFCGEKILAIAKKCRHCGSMLDRSNASGDNIATRLWSNKTKIIVFVFLLTVSLVLTWYVNVDEVVTKTIEYRNNLAYIPNSNEPFTGIYIPLPYDNGQVKSERHYKNGKKNGLDASWYENGYKKMETNYKDGKLDGLETSWYKYGDKKSEINSKDGNLDGLYVTWYENGQKESEVNYKNEKWDGLYVTWYKNGQAKSETHYKNGNVNGLITAWYDNGQKKGEGNYKDEKEEGLHTEWYENGQRRAEVNFKDGKKDGLSTWWSENGQKQSEVNYKDGLEIMR